MPGLNIVETQKIPNSGFGPVAEAPMLALDRKGSFSDFFNVSDAEQTAALYPAPGFTLPYLLAGSAYAAEPAAASDTAATVTTPLNGTAPGVAEAFSKLPTRDYVNTIGDHSFDSFKDLIELMQSPEQTMDGAMEFASADRLLGEERVVGTAVTAALMASIASYLLLKDYGKRALIAGRVKWLTSFIQTMTIGWGVAMLGRVATDYHLYRIGGELDGFGADDINWNIQLSVMVVWAVWSGMWSLIPYYSTQFSGLLHKVLMGKDVSYDDFIASAGKFFDANVEELKKLVKTNPETGKRTLSFDVDAEHLTEEQSTRLAKLFGDSKADIAFETDLEDYDTLKTTLAGWVKDGLADVSVTATTAHNVKKIRIAPGEGTIAEGSVIRTAKGETVLSSDLKVTDDTGPIDVVKGVLTKETAIDVVKNPNAVYDLDEPTIVITVSGPAARILPLTGNGVASRPFSSSMAPLLNHIPLSLRRPSLNLLLRAVPEPVRKLLRTKLLRTSANVTLEISPETTEQILAEALPLFRQKYYVAQLPEAPVVDLSATTVDFMAKELQKKTVAINIPVEQTEKFHAILKASGIEPIEIEISDKGHVVLVSIAAILPLLKQESGELTELAKRREAQIVIDNLRVAAKKVGDLTAIESFAAEVPPGSVLSLDEFRSQKYSGWQRFFNSAATFGRSTSQSLGFSRWRSVVAMTLQSAVLSAPLISFEKWAVGLDDPWVYLTSGLRTIPNNLLNRFFGNSIQKIAGKMNYSNWLYYLMSIMGLTAYEAVNEIQQANATLYDEHAQRILGENRPEVLAEKARMLRQKEQRIVRSQPEIRDQILYKRVALGLPTGVEQEGDALRLKALYDEGGNDAVFEAEFLRGMIAADLWSVAQKDADVAGFFKTEMDENRGRVEAGLSEWNLSWPQDL